MLKLTYHGHSCFELEADGKRIIVDPFITGNSHAKIKPEEVKVDAVLVSHGHGDHVGDAVQIAKANGCVVVSNFEIANWVGAQGVEVHGMHIGGSFVFPFGRVKLTPAIHGSSLPDGSYGGMPAGILIWMGGKCVYYAGDTGIHSEMALYGRLNPIDLALLPIGDNFTMGIDDAVEAAVMCAAKEAVPIHYETFPVIPADPHEFVKKCQARGVNARVVGFGETVEV
jgi:L-ascorbate metabolism protein UlaG (beta-lactamase superfamily)